MFVEKLIEQIKDKKSVVCMGLDPRLDQIAKCFEEDDESQDMILDFNETLIDEVCDLIPVIKPNIAFYEQHGIDGIHALIETIAYAHRKDLLVILDSKRNDIGSTAEAYADSTYKVYKTDSCTINSYLGKDTIKPYLKKYESKGMFILVKTSNESSGDFQDLWSTSLMNMGEEYIEKKYLVRNYIQMAHLINDWAKELPIYEGFHNMGAVVGATYPEQLHQIRHIIKESYILLPGYGAQGATAKDIKYGFYENGLGAIVNSSRGIMFAHEKSNLSFPNASRQEILKMNKEINKEIGL